MIRIGDFSRLARVSVETLRHWDEVGLLRPARVDDSTGYRHYRAGQLATVYRILALKDLGFSLAHIATILGDLSAGQLQALLESAREQAERDIAALNERLVRITARLRQLEEEQTMSDYDVVLKETPVLLAASCRVTVPANDQVPELLGAAFDAAYAHLRRSGAKDTGPCQAIWYQPAAVLTNEEVDAVVPIDRAISASAAVAVAELPSRLVASVIHRGSFATMSHAHAAILSWLEANGYESDGTYREVYIDDSPGAPDRAVTEIQYPVTAVRRKR